MLRRLPDPVESVLGVGQRRAALARALGGLPARMQERGHLYAKTGRVDALRLDPDDAIVATVSGTEDYTTSWYWDGDDWDHGCSCPVSYECKHAYAVAEVLVGATPGPPRSRPPASVPAIRGSELENRFLRQLMEADDVWERVRALESLLQASEVSGISAVRLPFAEILEEPDAELMCWQLAKAIAERIGAPSVPAALRAFGSRKDLERRYAEGRRDEVQGLLQQWAAERTAAGKKQLRFAVGLREGEGCHLTLEAQLTSARLVDEPRTAQQLAQLVGEVARDPRVLSSTEANLLDRFVGAVPSGSRQSCFEVDPTLVADLCVRQAPRELLVWSADVATALAERAGIRPGEPVRCEPAGVRLQPEVFGEGDRVMIGLYAAWDDGRRRRLERTVLVAPMRRGGPAPMLVADGALWPLVEVPPDEVLEAFTATPAIEVPKAERLTTLPRLAASFANIDAALELHARRVAVEPLVILELRRDDWLEVRLFARERGSGWTPGAAVGATTRVFERTARGRWVAATSTVAGEANQAATAIDGGEAAEAPVVAPEVDEASAAPGGEADVWIDLPDDRSCAPVLGWIESLGARPGSAWHAERRVPGDVRRGSSLWLRVDEDVIERIAGLWAERPRALYFGNPRLRRVLSGEESVRAQVRVHASGTDWFSVSAAWAAEGLALSDADVARLRAAQSSFVRLSSGWVRKEVAETQDEAAAALAELGIEVGEGEQRLTLWQLAGASDAAVDAVVAMGVDDGAVAALRKLRERIQGHAGVPEQPLPKGLQAELRPYQRRGFDFLCYTASLGIGAILADDMGLGKTVQALAWLCWLREKRRGRGPALVVCPTSVAPNWVREAERFTPGLRVLMLGSGRGRRRARERWRDYDLVVTNYALLRQDIDFWKDVELRAVILDEAQQIKNPDAAVARAACSLQARFRLALTGTPLENRALDLWSILEFVNPGYLGKRSDFSARFDRVDVPDHQRRWLAAKIRPLLMRRLKRDVATELPERIEERIDCELTPGQRKAYVAELRRSRALVERVAQDADGLRRNKIEVLAALTRLRQVCCHPGLAGGDVEAGSGKFDALLDLLETLLGEGHKVLVFSQFVRCLELIDHELCARAIPRHILTGKSTDRGALVDAFQNDEQPCVFLISLRAGGTGLNLTAASYVVLFDPWWNPAVEAQAIDRSHRIGQDKTVIAYRLIASGTIEEKIFDMQQRKAALARDVLGEDGFARTLSREDLDFLLTPA